MNKIFTEKEITQIIDMYEDLIPIDEIIRRFNTDEHNIRAILKENQIDRKYNTFKEELTQRVVDQHLNGLLHKEISYNKLVSSHGINKIIDRLNIPRMTYSDRNRKYDRNQNYFDKIDVPNKAYILGLLYADGNNFTSHNCITLSLQESDKDLLMDIKNEIGYSGPLRANLLNEKNTNHKNQYILCINDEHMSKELENKGLVNHKSLILRFPSWLDSSLYNHFVRGYFDGDGCIYYDDKRSKCSIQIAGTKEMCVYIQNIFKDININSYIYKPGKNDVNTYILSICGNASSYKFLNWIYNDGDLKLYRKYRKYLDFCNLYLKVA